MNSKEFNQIYKDVLQKFTNQFKNKKLMELKPFLNSIKNLMMQHTSKLKWEGSDYELASKTIGKFNLFFLQRMIQEKIINIPLPLKNFIKEWTTIDEVSKCLTVSIKFDWANQEGEVSSNNDSDTSKAYEDLSNSHELTYLSYLNIVNYCYKDLYKQAKDWNQDESLSKFHKSDNSVKNIIRTSLSNYVNKKSSVFSEIRDLLLNDSEIVNKTYLALKKLNFIEELEDGRIKCNVIIISYL